MTGDLPNPAPHIKRTLQRHDAGGHCPTCDKTIDMLGAFDWAFEHAQVSGHNVLVDYQVRYVVHPERRAA